MVDNLAIFFKYDYNNSKKYLEVDDLIRKMALSLGAKELIVPSVIDEMSLERLGYFKYSKNILLKIKETDGLFLTPAACLNVYSLFSDKMVKEEITTVRNQVFRNEEDDAHLLNFNVREIIAIGQKDFVSTTISRFVELARNFCNELKIVCEIVPATDSFVMNRENEILKYLQASSGNKKEIVANINGKKIVIGSINYHGTHFSKAFGYVDDMKTVSACIGFGIERIITVLEMLENG